MTEDDHGLQSDDFIVSKKPYAGERLQWLRVAKALRAPARAGATGLFLQADGSELETGSWWQTRIAAPGELAIGQLAFCPTKGSRGRLPAERSEVRLMTWILGKITDVSGLPAEVSIGATPCDAVAIRVPRD